MSFPRETRERYNPTNSSWSGKVKYFHRLPTNLKTLHATPFAWYHSPRITLHVVAELKTVVKFRLGRKHNRVELGKKWLTEYINKSQWLWIPALEFEVVQFTGKTSLQNLKIRALRRMFAVHAHKTMGLLNLYFILG